MGYGNDSYRYYNHEAGYLLNTLHKKSMKERTRGYYET